VVVVDLVDERVESFGTSGDRWQGSGVLGCARFMHGGDGR